MFQGLRDLSRLLRAARVLARHDALVPVEYLRAAPYALRVARWFVGG
jgi:hypothetical protein